ncbi:uncharacterized protein PAC_00757 [Phialocephala subalpina]|uniref:Uncharacterized protein n=1 Tax=Phialocephala subalpina TaxID=576137 RepID=A0A1L7WDM0_9HELO|nr:uncharacterized protein PAC_00757 [Phialocephala subalpina]
MARPEKESESTESRNCKPSQPSEKRTTKSRDSYSQSTVKHLPFYAKREANCDKSQMLRSSQTPEPVTHNPFFSRPQRPENWISPIRTKLQSTSGTQISQSWFSPEPSPPTPYIVLGQLTVELPTEETFKFDEGNLTAH